MKLIQNVERRRGCARFEEIEKDKNLKKKLLQAYHPERKEEVHRSK